MTAIIRGGVERAMTEQFAFMGGEQTVYLILGEFPPTEIFLHFF